MGCLSCTNNTWYTKLGVFLKQVNCLVEIEGLKRHIKQLHVDSVDCETGELDRADEEVVTQSDDNVLLQEFTVGASDYLEDTGVIESKSKSDITKRQKLLLKTPQKNSVSSLRSANAFRLKQEKEEVTKAMSSITLNDLSDFKNFIKTGAISVCERVGIKNKKAPARIILEKTH